MRWKDDFGREELVMHRSHVTGEADWRVVDESQENRLPDPDDADAERWDEIRQRQQDLQAAAQRSQKREFRGQRDA